MKHILTYLLLFLNFIALCALGTANLSVFISPEKFWLPALFGMAYPYILVVNIVFMVLWIVTKPKFALLSFVVILTGFTHLSNYFQISGENTSAPGIRVTSYNVKYFMGNTQFPNKENADHILNFLRQDNADIICLQEVRLNKRQIFDIKNTRLPQVKHLQLAHNSHAGGLTTLTRFPILNMGEIRFKNSGNMIIYTDLLVNSDTVRVFNCHLQSYRLREAEINSIDSLEFGDQQKTKEKLKVLSLKFQEALVKRAQQAATLRAAIDESPYPAIVCGDFNDTPVSFTYRMVKGDLLDSFTESGKGTANTYNGKLPSFRIDYIFHSPKFNSYNFNVSNLEHSDHFPISCDLIPAKSKESAKH